MYFAYTKVRHYDFFSLIAFTVNLDVRQFPFNVLKGFVGSNLCIENSL